MGPTACGKTDLAIRLARELPIEIVSVDASMVYRGLDIGTAKPSKSLLDEIPHHLINIRAPHQPYSAANFCKDAQQAIDTIFAKQKIPLLVGGTMLYFKALQEGLSELPSTDVLTRQTLLEEAAANGWESLYQQLSIIDPVSAARIHPNDPQRVSRALEVYRMTGKTLSAYFDEQKPAKSSYHYYSLGLLPTDRTLLHQRIATRFEQMLSEGWIEEVKQLLPVAESILMKTIGYKQICLYLQGIIDEKTMITQGVIATRQLAKRQMTWLRHWPDIKLLDPDKDI